MNTPAKIRIFFLLALIFLLFGIFETIDWTAFVFHLAPLSHPELLYSRITKTSTSFCVAILAWSIRHDGIASQDTNKLNLCFIAIFCGDILFLLDEIAPVFDIFAVGMFAIGHLLVIWRNGQGFWAYRREIRSNSRQMAWDVGTAIGLIILAILLFVVVIFPHVIGTPWLYIMPVYASVLVISLWTGWASLRIKFFNPLNAKLIAIGATCFFIGDFLVGINLSFPFDLSRMISLYLTWIFYTPAITCLALSGYRWNN